MDNAPAAALQAAGLTHEQLVFLNLQMLAALGPHVDVQKVLADAAQFQAHHGMLLPLQNNVTYSAEEQVPAPQEELEKPKPAPRRRAAKGGRGKKAAAAAADTEAVGGGAQQPQETQPEKGEEAPAINTPKQRRPARAAAGKRPRKYEDDAGEEMEESTEEAAARKKAIKEASKEKKKRAARVTALKGVHVEGLAGYDEEGATFTVRGSSGMYTVTLTDHACRCTCMDHAMRKRNCKHIEVILAKLRIVDEPEKWFQAVERTGASVSGKLDAAESAYLAELLDE